jgi:hypothetical protein
MYVANGRRLRIRGLRKSMGDSVEVSVANPEFSATAKYRGIFFEISPFEKAHGLTLNMREIAEWL